MVFAAGLLASSASLVAYSLWAHGLVVDDEVFTCAGEVTAIYPESAPLPEDSVSDHLVLHVHRLLGTYQELDAAGRSFPGTFRVCDEGKFVIRFSAEGASENQCGVAGKFVAAGSFNLLSRELTLERGGRIRSSGVYECQVAAR